MEAGGSTGLDLCGRRGLPMEERGAGVATASWWSSSAARPRPSPSWREATTPEMREGFHGAAGEIDFFESDLFSLLVAEGLYTDADRHLCWRRSNIPHFAFPTPADSIPPD
jgi:hypothetical protein